MSSGAEQVLEAGDWRVVFERRGDRLAHVVARRVGERWVELIASREGTPDETWPASPPLQELHFESRQSGRRLGLGVGMAGCGHWSLSVELDPVADECRFDVACRSSQAPAWMGSSYRLTCAADRAIAGEVQWTAGEAHLVIAEGAELLVESTVVRVSPRMVGGPWPRTLQWGYLLSDSR